MGKPAARIGDMTAHGGVVTGPGCPTVLIGKMPAATMGDMHVCPMVTPGVPPIPHVGGPLVGPVPPTVLIGKKPAACVGDMAICVGPPSTILPPGCMTVLLGQAGGGGGGGGGGSTKAAQAASTLSASSKKLSISPKVPQPVQLAIFETASVLGEAEAKALIKQVEEAFAHVEDTGEKKEPLTITDLADVLKKIEKNEGYEAARFFAAQVDFQVVTTMAMQFVIGNDTNPENDPNVMPTRFMILYGADDNKLQCVDNHPDCTDGEDHKINVANLRKGLKLLGFAIAESGPYDDELLKAHIRFCGSVMTHTAPVIEKQKKDEEAQQEEMEKEEAKQKSEEEEKKKEESKKSGEEAKAKPKGHGLADALKQDKPSEKTKTDESKMGGAAGGGANTVSEKVESKASPSEDVSTTERIEKSKLTIVLDIDPEAESAYDDIYTLYSMDSNKSYLQKKTVKDDANKQNNSLELIFTDVDISLSYTLEVDSGNQGETTVIFENKRYGEW